MLIVQLSIVDLGAQFPDRGIPCNCPFHSNFHVFLRKQNCYHLFKNHECKFKLMDGNKGIYKTYKAFRNHCIACEEFYHKCLGHFLVYLYQDQKLWVIFNIYWEPK